MVTQPIASRMGRPIDTKAPKVFRASDLRGAAQLASQATLGVTDIAEGLHQAIWSTISGGKAADATPASKARTRGLTGFVYASIRGVTALVATAVDKSLATLAPYLAPVDDPRGDPQLIEDSRQREALLAALNGVLGDRLVISQHDFATPMSFRCRGRALNWLNMPIITKPSSKVMLFIHGLCMNDLQWSAVSTDGSMRENQWDQLAQSLGYTPIYLRYNTGLPIWVNGQTLAAQLNELLINWPVAIKQLSVVTHSMGGLVMRSACHAAQTDVKLGREWREKLDSLVFLGTPHHGAPLEKAGSWIDLLLGSSRFTKPFIALTKLRSSGITDLRQGTIAQAPESDVSLPSKVRCYTIAACTAAQRGLLADRLTGDGLVPLQSALGKNANSVRTLNFATDAQWIAYRTNHMQLLHRAAVAQQVETWLRKRK
jgi:PGAP1-like protein